MGLLKKVGCDRNCSVEVRGGSLELMPRTWLRKKTGGHCEEG